MKYIKKINELKISGIVLHDPVLEMARINDPKEFPFDVFVYGGDSYGSGRNEHGESHFHFADKIRGGKWCFSGDYNWTGLRKEKKLLIEWLDKPNDNLNLYTNLEIIRQQWNMLNTDNNNVSQIKRIR